MDDKGEGYMIKKYNRARFREKFRRFRIWFLILAAVFLFSLAGELFFFGDMGYIYDRGSGTFSAFFSDLFTGELLLFLTVFLFGVTLYAPVLGFLSVAGRGLFSGFCLSVLFAGTENRKGVWVFGLTLLYLLLSSWLFLGYATFCTTTALQLYSDPAKTRQGGDKHMYGGTLFYSTFSRGSVNFRFLLSYLLFFLGAVFVSFLLSLGFAALRSLL